MYRLSASRTPPLRDKQIRDYVLGLLEKPEEPVWIEPQPAAKTNSGEPHLILLSPRHDPEAVLVSLFGYRFRVDLGPNAGLPSQIVFFCKSDGSGIRRLGAAEEETAIAHFQGSRFIEPWREGGFEGSHPID
jgi:hypothetical protein